MTTELNTISLAIASLQLEAATREFYVHVVGDIAMRAYCDSSQDDVKFMAWELDGNDWLTTDSIRDLTDSVIYALS
jgi:hypothetical protein